MKKKKTCEMVKAEVQKAERKQSTNEEVFRRV